VKLLRLNIRFKAIKEVALEFQYSIKLLCEILNVNRSSYYSWLKKTITDREIENEKIKEEIAKLHEKVDGIYGYRRMTMNLNRIFDKKINQKRIYRLMKHEMNISSVIRRKKDRVKKSSAEYASENILNREFSADFPKQKILTDITEFKYGKDSKVYLCATFDLFDNSIVSYSMSDRADTQLVLQVLGNTYKQDNNKEMLLHSDRGSQFTSKDYVAALKEAGITHSMSRAGKCIDNGPMEGFFGILKTERYYLKKYQDYEELEEDIHSYMKFYNEDRLQKKLGELSPLEFRNQYIEKCR
jgi:transposase InsO family protein